MPFKSDLELRHRPGHSRWEVIRALHYRTLEDRLIIVPTGYRSDLASVPRLARYVIDPHIPTTRRPAVVHDYLYTHLTHCFTKREADQIFYQALLEEGMRPAVAWLAWRAVRLGGRGTWRR